MEPSRELVLNSFFLKTTFFLDPQLTTSVTIGVCRDKGVGVIFAGKKKSIVFPFHIFYQLAISFENIQSCLEGAEKGQQLSLDSGEFIGTKRFFGKNYVKLAADKQHYIMLNESEYNQFHRYLPQINRRITELFSREVAIRSFVEAISSGEEIKPPPDLCPYLINRLLEEVSFR